MDSKIEAFAKEVVFLGDITLRIIPGYLCAYAGDDGVIRFIHPNGTIRIPRTKEYRTTKGSYLYIDLINDDYTQVTKPVHRLVCLAFHKKPVNPEINVEPNHINGNKHDNRPSNLEWLTRSSNVQHAYNTGLTTQGLRITVHDKVSGTSERFNTLSHCARVFQIGRNVMRDIISKHRKDPYLGRYVFEIDDSFDKKVSRHQAQGVAAKDYLNDGLTIYGSYTDASQAVCVASSTIRHNAVSEKDYLHSGYVFRNLNRVTQPWPEYSQEEIMASLKKRQRVHQ